jgi:histidinol-phosphatase (PHP family)
MRAIQQINYHTHTVYSDGRREPEAYIQEALRLGHPVIGFSDHAPIPGHPTRWNMDPDKLGDYFRELTDLKNRFADQIRVLISMEIDYIDGIIHPRSSEVSADRLDYVIGSVHFLRTEEGGLWDYESHPETIKDGVERLFHGDVPGMIRQYYMQLRKMVADHTPDVIGHLDRIKVLNDVSPFFDERSTWYHREIEQTLEVIRASGAIMEVNTKGVYSRGHRDPYPSYWILEKAKAMHIPVQLGADAHAPEFLSGSFGAVMENLHQIGYNKQVSRGVLHGYC